MKGQIADQIQPGSRWLSIFIGEKKSAIRLSFLIRVLDQVELFKVPLLPREFKGVIYFNEQAIPIVNWEAFGIEIFLNPLVLVLEQGKDRIGIEVEGTGNVEEYSPGPDAKEDGFWIELDSDKGVWGLDEKRLFKTLRQSRVSRDFEPGT